MVIAACGSGVSDNAADTPPPRNRPPVGVDQSVSVAENSELVIDVAAVDPDGDIIVYTVLGTPSIGTLSGSGPRYYYESPIAGSTSLVVSLSDGKSTGRVTVGINVYHINQPPMATAANVSTREDTPVAILLSGTDPEGDALTYTVHTTPAHGVLEGRPPELAYLPNPGFVGTDALSFSASDGELSSSERSIAITVQRVATTMLAVGDAHACRLRADHVLSCWGSLGVFASATPKPIDTRTEWDAVFAGAVSVYALDRSNALWSFNEGVPAQLPELWLQVNSSTERTCGIRTDASLWCWAGAPEMAAQIGDGQSWQHVVTAGDFACALEQTGALWCWGMEDPPLPVQVGTDTDWKTLVAGARHACALKTDESLWCWGANASGQLGDATNDDRAEPTPVAGTTAWSDVKAGSAHTCALASGALWCWGDNANGQLGDDTTSASNVPKPIVATQTWAQLEAGGNTSCAIDELGDGWCWGANDRNQLGDGTSVERHTPVKIGLVTEE